MLRLDAISMFQYSVWNTCFTRNTQCVGKLGRTLAGLSTLLTLKLDIQDIANACHVNKIGGGTAIRIILASTRHHKTASTIESIP